MDTNTRLPECSTTPSLMKHVSEDWTVFTFYIFIFCIVTFLILIYLIDLIAIKKTCAFPIHKPTMLTLFHCCLFITRYSFGWKKTTTTTTTTYTLTKATAKEVTTEIKQTKNNYHLTTKCHQLCWVENNIPKSRVFRKSVKSRLHKTTTYIKGRPL